MSSRPLDGIRIIDLTRALAGPYCTMLFADLGAEVIKVEPPQGDMSRSQGPYRQDDELREFGGYFASINRNKRSISIDLTTSDGKELLRRLIRDADALIENFRPGVMDQLGLAYETLREGNPRLVYGAIRGFGDPRTGKSPYVDRPAFDVVAQAMGGVMAITGRPDGEPTKVGPGIGDIFPAVLTAFGVMACVTDARRTGRGRFVDVAMYDAIVSLCERVIHQHAYVGAVPGREGNDHPLLAPFGVFRASDGWMAIAAPLDKQWARLAEVIGRPELGTDPRLATNAARVVHRDEMRAAIEEWTSVRTRAEITAALSDTVPAGPVNTAEALFADPHLTVRQMLAEVEQPGSAAPVTVAGQPVKVTDAPPEEFRRAPLLGEHTDEILTELGYQREDIARLRVGRTVR
ncbi:CaiB/BaiF CoA transferase family protein [Streptomyces ochraceiscleroticus]|uniref:CaiB/BaiF CoA transferase family protein n=1 Tax=Streptomyces ochraceiscleroticus TaxID=47761 RepID=A0ABW1MJT9_9ACTN|nr:CoA transferase [Streptomyces ochraceiscleroticus]